MDDPTAQHSSFDAFSQFDLLDQQSTQNLDFLSFNSPCDFTIPTLDNFEFDIDTGLEGFDDQLQVFAVDQSAFQIPRGFSGPLSTITTSGVSESSRSDDIFSDVSSLYGKFSVVSDSFGNDSLDFFNSQLEMEFQRVTVGSDYGAPQSKLLDDSDPTSFGQLPPTPPRSPPAVERPLKRHLTRPSFSDYGPPRRSSFSAEYFNTNINFTGIPQPTVSPTSITTELPSSMSPTMPIDDVDATDSRRKYRCNHCPRSFARAYNLKTHMATHDPNRLKPHTCSHRNCGRSFSRKHDLQRHLVAIHKESDKKEVGVASGPRTWCADCGKGSVGDQVSCKCIT